jgi:hypothetical protein
LKLYKIFFLILAAAVVATAAWADGVDPKVIIQGGGGSTPITITDPNPTVTTPAQANTGQCFNKDVTQVPACVFDVFQNQTGNTLTHLTIFIPTIDSLVFKCDPTTLLIFFNDCNSNGATGGTDVNFFNTANSPFAGVPTATPCNSDLEEECGMPFVGGEFAVDIEGAGVVTGTVIPVTVITTPEPGAALLMLFGAMVFGLFRLTRRTVLSA